MGSYDVGVSQSTNRLKNKQLPYADSHIFGIYLGGTSENRQLSTRCILPPGALLQRWFGGNPGVSHHSLPSG